ncbi:MAG: RagB/SusD family nutrient uptake outer membrane protein [Bacteroidetes bacterium]|nr:MAG: RagB/SusD family nutrient uptake outer membrane protein [Bacteroidota bacterium]
MKTLSTYKITCCCMLILFSACKKSEFLNAKPDQNLVVPTTIEELQALLDNDQVMNGTGNFGVMPAFGEVGADNYYVNDDLLNSYVDPLGRKTYTWQKELYAGEEIVDWDFPYRSIFYCNEVLEGLKKINPDNSKLEAYNNAKGSALFHRAHMYYQLAQIFAPGYDAATAITDLGIPLRELADIGEKINRSTLAETYTQITNDLKESISLLPITPLYKTRPSKPAAYALLARAYQTMEDYEKSFAYADSCLQLKNDLIDFNTVDTNSVLPFPRFNAEVILHSVMITSDIVVVSGLASVDSNLYSSYSIDDLRRPCYFIDAASGGSLATGMIFRGTYDGSPYYFAGLATDEVYLIRAETAARMGDVTSAMKDLNTLMSARWRAGTFVPFTAADANDALHQILVERRKELLFRGTRWTDLRRLNKDPQFESTSYRLVAGQTYSIPPNDPRYVYPIPDNVISFNPGMIQNSR